MTQGEAVIKVQPGEWEVVPSFELEEDNRNQLHEFRSSLERASLSEPCVLPDSLFDVEAQSAAGPPNRPVTETIAAAIRDKIVHNGNGLYTSTEFAWLGEAGLTSFNVLRSAKAETSAHQVFFGLMTNPNTNECLPVAVKPCTKNPRKAYLDWLNNSLVARTGRKHFVPVGFIQDSDRAYSITLIERGVETFDNSEWRNVLQDPRNQDFVGQREQLKDVGEELADLHDDRIFHNDPEFKNIASDPTGSTFFIDWESAQVFGQEASDEVLIEGAVNDLEIVYYSAATSDLSHGVGLLSSYARHLQWTHFDNHILTPYLARRLDRDSSSRSIDLIDAIEARVKHYALAEFTAGAVNHFMRADA